MNDIGFSVIYSLAERDIQFYRRLLAGMLAAGCTAIELQTPQHDTLNDPALLRLIGQFDYRSVHTSDLHSAEQDGAVLEYYRELADHIAATALTIHPHTMSHWAWLRDYFGQKASFENMDRFKTFGQTAADMTRVMAEYPGARWTFDLNHVFTNDTSMAEVPAFYAELGNPGHYHISGYKDAQLPHTTLYSSTHQDKIITDIRTDAPIIIESFGNEDIQDFQKELDYILPRLAQK